jgi:hypothetical protein
MIRAPKSPANDRTPSTTTQPDPMVHAPLGVSRLQRERDCLREERARLVLEVERLKEENDALRASAEIWIRMYDGQRARARQIERRAADNR